MIKLCDDVLEEVKLVPENTFYRTVSENNFRHFKKVCQENDDYEVVEDILHRGQVEEMIMDFQEELEMIPLYAADKPWEVTKESADWARFVHENVNDFSDPPTHIPPELKFQTWSGIYQVTYTPEEIKKMEDDKKKQQEEEAAGMKIMQQLGMNK